MSDWTPKTSKSLSEEGKKKFKSSWESSKGSVAEAIASSSKVESMAKSGEVPYPNLTEVNSVLISSITAGRSSAKNAWKNKKDRTGYDPKTEAGRKDVNINSSSHRTGAIGEKPGSTRKIASDDEYKIERRPTFGGPIEYADEPKAPSKAPAAPTSTTGDNGVTFGGPRLTSGEFNKLDAANNRKIGNVPEAIGKKKKKGY